MMLIETIRQVSKASPVKKYLLSLALMFLPTVIYIIVSYGKITNYTELMYLIVGFSLFLYTMITEIEPVQAIYLISLFVYLLVFLMVFLPKKEKTFFYIFLFQMIFSGVQLFFGAFIIMGKLY